jgi:two-component system, NtrC family, response regulator HydG
VTDDERSTEVRRGAGVPAETACLRFRIEVIAGDDAGRVLDLAGDRPQRALVGQGVACDLRLADRQVSRRHFALDITADGIRLTDLASTNGTFVDGLRVFDALLRGGELVQLGGVTLRVTPVAETKASLPKDLRFGRMLGQSREMRRLYPLCAKIASSDVPVIVEGETGTGKELLAEAIHAASRRASGPFVVFDCSAVQPNLLESSLFGHERGAFTGAIAARRGVFEQAHGGTLFIDEIGELEGHLQPRLLRAVERNEIQRMGAEQWRRVDVRVVVATRRDLDREVQEGRFRDDLFFRLAVGRIELPPLRARQGDIAFLARSFWRELGGTGELPIELAKRLEAYAWPGNVRELKNAIARRIAIGEEPVPSSQRSPTDPFGAVLALDLPLAVARQRVVEAFEQRYVERVLERYDGNVGRAAAASGIKRRYFQVLRARHKG